jgi:hypothetical protein
MFPGSRVLGNVERIGCPGKAEVGQNAVFEGRDGDPAHTNEWRVPKVRSAYIVSLATFLHGEQLIPIFLGVLILVVGILSFCSWIIIRRLKPRIGRRAYLVAISPFALIAIAILAEMWREAPNEGQPSVVPVARLSALIKGLPADAHFSLSGLAFFHGKLYVGTNLGLVEVTNGAPSQLYRFQSSDAVISGPWLDRADRLLWAVDDHTGELLRFDGNAWSRMPKPTPAKGYYSRGDVLEGVRPIGNDKGFWMATGGTAWTWDAVSLKWVQVGGYVPDPKNYKVNEVIGVLPIGQTPLLLVRHESLSFLIGPDEDFSSDELVVAPNPTGPAVPRAGKPFFADTWAIDQDSGYICTRDHVLLKVTKEQIAPFDAPGPCETVASGEDQSVLASIKGKGIFRYAQGQWTLLAESPYASGAGDYWTYLAAEPGQIALALNGKPVVDHERTSGSDMRFKQNAPTNLWVSTQGKLNPVQF